MTRFLMQQRQIAADFWCLQAIFCYFLSVAKIATCSQVQTILDIFKSLCFCVIANIYEKLNFPEQKPNL